MLDTVMGTKDLLPIVISLISLMFSLVSLFFTVKSMVFDRIERSLLSIDDKFIQYPELRKYFYNKFELLENMEENDKYRCLAICEYILDVFSSVISQRNRFYEVS